MTWAPPEEPNGIILSYRVTRISDTGENAVETDGDTLTTKLYGVVACQNYTVTVAASTSKGFGNESNQWEIYVTGEGEKQYTKGHIENEEDRRNSLAPKLNIKTLFHTCKRLIKTS